MSSTDAYGQSPAGIYILIAYGTMTGFLVASVIKSSPNGLCRILWCRIDMPNDKASDREIIIHYTELLG